MIDTNLVELSDWRLFERIQNILNSNDIDAIYADNIFNSAANVVTREIMIVPVVGKYTNLIAMHEIGHILNPTSLTNIEMMLASFGDVEANTKVIGSETKAWEWARSNSNSWDYDSQHFMDKSLEGYTNPSYDLTNYLQALLYKERKI